MGIGTHLAPVITLSRLSYNGINQKVQLSIKVYRSRLQQYQRPSSTLIRKQLYSTEAEKSHADKKDAETHREHTSKEIDVARESPYAGLSMGQKVVEVGKDATYIGIIIAAVGVLGVMIYAIVGELFSSNSPNVIYDRAFKKCISDTQLSAALGEPVKGYGETTRRGRRRHVSHSLYTVNDQQRMRMQFYVEGSEKKGTVQLEMVKDETGKYNYRYLLVQLNEYPYRTFILEDNR